MTELLILAVLLNGESTIYKIRQKLKSMFFLFLGASFGSVHPAVKKLENQGLISVKKKMTEGGKKSSYYSISKKGKDYFKEIMTADIDEPVVYSEQIAGVKIMLLDCLDENLRKYAIASVKKYYKIKLINAKELLETSEKTKPSDKTNLYYRTNLLKHQIDRITKDIRWIEGF